MGELSHRERVEMALNHEEPDRVPIEFGGADNTIYEAPSYWPIKPKYGYSALVNYLGLKNVSEPQILASNCVASVDERILDRFGSDFVTYFMRPLGEIKVEADGTVIISWGGKGKNGGILLGTVRRPAQEPKDNI